MLIVLALTKTPLNQDFARGIRLIESYERMVVLCIWQRKQSVIQYCRWWIVSDPVNTNKIIASYVASGQTPDLSLCDHVILSELIQPWFLIDSKKWFQEMTNPWSIHQSTIKHQLLSNGFHYIIAMLFNPFLHKNAFWRLWNATLYVKILFKMEHLLQREQMLHFP